MPDARVPTGVAPLDALLHGGLETDCLTELYGEGGSGKTLLCIQAAVETTLKGRWVFYIDTEGVSLARLEAVTGGRLADVLKLLLLATPKDLAEQSRAVETAGALAREGRRTVGLIVLDSATFYYRLALSSETEDESRIALGAELADLLATALHAHVPVLFTNQVWRRPSDGSLEPLGGSFIGHAAKTILRIDRLPGNRRRAVLLKHRSLAEGSAEFRITSTGLEGLGGASAPSGSEPAIGTPD
ncbi:MAG: DNA repair and recombination protein RadB [Thermoplasmata archaeon]|nr:DNA repair and recombination protein RadB [Thermoplasmata archaeon]